MTDMDRQLRLERMPLPTAGAHLATVSVDVPGTASSVLVTLTPAT